MQAIDQLSRFLVDEGIAPAEAVLDGSLLVVDASRRNRNHRASWNVGSGVFIKQAGGLYGDASTLRNEADFYAASARVARRPHTLPLAEVVGYYDASSLLVLRWLAKAKPLWHYRKTTPDPSAVYSILGRALGELNAFTSSDRFREDAYASSLAPATPPWVTYLHKPRPDVLRHVSPAQMQVLRILQEDGAFGRHLENVAGTLQPRAVIHADLKADNILVEDQPEGPKVTIIDWELAQLGDPTWDISALLQDALTSWLEAVQPTNGDDLEASVTRAGEATRYVHRACRSLWSSYETALHLSPVESDVLLMRAVNFSAAHLIRVAYERSDAQDAMSSNDVAMLQVALNLFEQPREGMRVLYGLSLRN